MLPDSYHGMSATAVTAVPVTMDAVQSITLHVAILALQSTPSVVVNYEKAFVCCAYVLSAGKRIISVSQCAGN